MKGRTSKWSVYVSLHVCMLILIHGPHLPLYYLFIMHVMVLHNVSPSAKEHNVPLFASILAHLCMFFFFLLLLSIHPISKACQRDNGVIATIHPLGATTIRPFSDRMCRYPCVLLGDRNERQEVVFLSAFHLLAKYSVITFNLPIQSTTTPGRFVTIQ